MRVLIVLLVFISGLSLVGQSSKPKPRYIMMDMRLQMEATDAINQMYDNKFEQAEVKFKQLIERMPEHPLPYYLMGLNQWWKMMPYPEEDERLENFAPDFIDYMEKAAEKAEELYDKDENDIEASFFLCASYGLLARYYAENGHKVKSINHARKVFSYFKKVDDNNKLSPEFLFGSALFKYYAAWFHEEFPMLRPVLAFFPKGDKPLGIKQLVEVTNFAFWTRTEAQYFLMRIYYNEEDDDAKALPVAEYLANTFPDNAYFQRMHCRLSFTMGNWPKCKELSETILYKYSIKMPGYEETSARYAAFFLGRYYYRRDKVKAKEYYVKSLEYAEKSKATEQNYYLQALTDLGKLSEEEKDFNKALEYYEKVVDNAERKNPLFKEAKEHIKKIEKEQKKKK
ncbi:MAG: tetratricopeptide repeat protein [Cytophagaceae bacterium]|nr:tetratricopeptide repeat protein [Cytophagaceae bacterium]